METTLTAINAIHNRARTERKKLEWMNAGYVKK